MGEHYTWVIRASSFLTVRQKEKPVENEVLVPGRETCPDCHRPLASTAIVSRHREKYCRYRIGKMAQRPAVDRTGGVVQMVQRVQTVAHNTIVWCRMLLC